MYLLDAFGRKSYMESYADSFPKSHMKTAAELHKPNLVGQEVWEPTGSFNFDPIGWASKEFTP
jgi:hypothetical protein